MSAGLMDQLKPKHPLLCLARSTPWDFFESEFAPPVGGGRQARQTPTFDGGLVYSQAHGKCQRRAYRATLDTKSI